jgi:hypothetical protein
MTGPFTEAAANNPDDGSPILLGMIHSAMLMASQQLVGHFLNRLDVADVEYTPPNYPHFIEVTMATGVYRIHVEKIEAFH